MGPVDPLRCDRCGRTITKYSELSTAYNADEHAYVADLRAGTYREMVFAAEACQVAIIPGTSWNRSEPGLEDLVERAAAFA
jgi:hypothetical protein